MTNLEAKQEAIKKAYGKYWEILYEYVDKNGWCYGFFKTKTYFQTEFTSDKWRPKSLSGIELNNGWIRIESEADLPNHKLWLSDGKDVWQGNLFEMEFFAKRINTLATHYQPIVKPKPPIY